MAFIERSTVSHLMTLLAGILLFNGLIYLPKVGEYFKKYPIVIVILAIVILAAKDKIADAIGG